MEIHREVAARLRANPGILSKATHNLDRWQTRHGDGPLSACYREWLEILQSSTAEQVADLLVRSGEREDRLRQNSPFAGVLRPQDLWRIKKEARHASP